MDIDFKFKENSYKKYINYTEKIYICIYLLVEKK